MASDELSCHLPGNVAHLHSPKPHSGRTTQTLVWAAGRSLRWCKSSEEKIWASVPHIGSSAQLGFTTTVNREHQEVDSHLQDLCVWSEAIKQEADHTHISAVQHQLLRGELERGVWSHQLGSVWAHCRERWARVHHYPKSSRSGECCCANVSVLSDFHTQATEEEKKSLASLSGDRFWRPLRLFGA